MTDASSILVYGLVAAASPTVLLATLVVLGSGRGRLNGSVFLGAFLAGQVAAYALAFVLGSVFTFGEELPGTLAAVLESVAGVGLVGLGWAQRSQTSVESLDMPRSQALFDRLGRVGPRATFGLGLPLGVGVKRLLITLLAATTVASTDGGRDEEIALSALYLVVASAVAWGPVLVYLVLGSRADGLTADGRTWITAHERPLLVWTALALGLFLAVDGVLHLV